MKVHVRVPATTANLGPGFDALGLALTLWNEATFETRSDGQVLVRVEGDGANRLPQDAHNPIIGAVKHVYELAGENFTGLEMHCVNRVPLGSGLGSSSTAVLTGLLGGNTLLGNPFSADKMLEIATDYEGHPDNAAPALYGGLIAVTTANGQVITRKLPVATFAVTVVLPGFNFPTKKARAVLPQTVSRADAIFNISRTVLVVEALKSGDLALLGQVMDDRLHQPYRLPLIPGAAKAIEAAKQAGAQAVALSGAGPSLVAFSSKRETGIGAAMVRAFESAGLTARVFELEINQQGAEVSSI